MQRAVTIRPSSGTDRPPLPTPPPTFRAHSISSLRPLSTTSSSSLSTIPPRTTPSTIPVTERAALISRHFFSSASHPSSHPTMSYTVRKVGQPNTLEHRIYIEKDGVPISPFHDIPLYANAEKTVLNMIVEIPRWTNAKQEV